MARAKASAKLWKAGRGKLGFLDPLLGCWVARAESPLGPVQCTRSFERVLGGHYVRLEARWEFPSAPPGSQTKPSDARGAAAEAGEARGAGAARVYTEIALIGAGDGGKVGFWSFTSDGKRSQGTVADVRDIHAEAVGFEAQMSAGLARMAYWPANDGPGFHWVVESRNARGWRRFTEHRYHPA